MIAHKLGRIGYLPLALGLMIGPTLTYRVAVSDWEPTTLRGFPLPWHGDLAIGSGPPIQIFVIPALIDLAFYLALCFFLWRGVSRRLQRRGHAEIPQPVVAAVWAYALAGVSLLALHGLMFDWFWSAWYDTTFYEGILRIGVAWAV